MWAIVAPSSKRVAYSSVPAQSRNHAPHRRGCFLPAGMQRLWREANGVAAEKEELA
jgi:hypothetical protein